MKFKVYRSRDKGWRWRMVARNGKIIADQVEGNGYKRIAGCMKGIAAVRTGAVNAAVEIEE